MSTITTSSLTGFVSPDYRSIAKATRSFDAAAIKASTAVIVALVDIVLVLWVFPLANQLAEWAGVSLLNAIYVGAAAMVLSVPMVVVANIVVLRRIVHR